MIKGAYRLLLAVYPSIGPWHICGYARCQDVGPVGFYCSQHREPLPARLRFWWRMRKYYVVARRPVETRDESVYFLYGWPQWARDTFEAVSQP